MEWKSKVWPPIKYRVVGNRAWNDKLGKGLNQQRIEKYLRKKLLPPHWMLCTKPTGNIDVEVIPKQWLLTLQLGVCDSLPSPRKPTGADHPAPPFPPTDGADAGDRSAKSFPMLVRCSHQIRSPKPSPYPNRYDAM